MKSSRRFVVAAVLVGLTFTAGVFHLVGESERRVQLQVFSSAAHDRVSVFRWTVTDTIGAVDAVSALYAASQEVEKEEFEAFAQRILEAHSAIEAIAWLPRVSNENGGPNHYPVLFLEPTSENDPYYQLDCAAEPECNDALDRARQSGKIALTSQLELEVDGVLRRNVVALLPIYGNDQPSDLASRAELLPSGYAAVFLDVSKVWNSALTQLTPAGLDVSISGRVESGRMELLHQHASRLGNRAAPETRARDAITATTDLRIGGNTWRLVSSANHAFFAMHSNDRKSLVLAFGLLTTLLIGLQLYGRAVHTDTLLDANLRLVAAHEELERQRTQLRQIIDLVPHFIFVRDTRGRILLANQATADACGTTVAELVDENRGHLLGARLDALGTLDEDEETAASNAPSVRTNVVFEDIDENSRILNTTKLPYSFLGRNRDKQAVLCVAVDVTNIRDIEADKARLEAELRHSQKMESIGVLAGGIAHDFNNLLGSIIGNTELAASKLTEDSPVAKNLAEVLDASEHASKLVSQILTFSRKEELKLSRINAAEVVHGALDLIRPSIPRAVELRRDIDMLAGTILADETQMAQVVMNLCTNAYQAMQQRGGVLEIGLHSTLIDETKAAMRPGLEPGPHVRLRVRDTGCGMDEDALAHLFDPFFTTKSVGEGTGLGLSVVHGIVSSHGGRIFVESEPGIGTTFTAYIPSATAAWDSDTTMDDCDEDVRGREHILLIDDDTALLQTAAEMLDMLGYRVTACEDAYEALATFTEAPDSFDAVITDQAMPSLTGIEVARELLKTRPELPVIVATGFSNAVTAESALDFGLRGYVSKPYRMKDLGNALRAALKNCALSET